MPLLKALKPNVSQSLIGIVMVIIVCMGVVTAVRYHQYGQWKETPVKYFVNSTPMMSALDAFYWLRLAREYKTGAYFQGDNDKLRNYPTGLPRPERVPLLCLLIAKLSVFFDDNLYVTSVYLIMFLSGLFLIPFLLYFSKSGYPAAGIVGCLVGTFNSVYFARTSAGWVDTDALNLFFPFLTSLLILLACNTSHKKYTYLYSALAGLTLFAFSFWYTAWHFFIAYLITLIFSLSINRAEVKTVPVAALVFLLFSAPGVFGDKLPGVSLGIASYKYLLVLFVIASVMILVLSTNIIKNKRMRWISLLTFVIIIAALLHQTIKIDRFATTDIIANTKNFISSYILQNLSSDQPSLDQPTKVSTGVASVPIREVIREPLRDILSYILHNQALSVAGLVLFFLFVILHIKQAAPLAPVVFVGLMSLLGSNRFVMYLAPFAGVGFGYALTVGLAYLFEKLCIRRPFVKELAVYAVSFCFFLLILTQTAYDYIPQPAISAQTYSDYLDIKNRLPANSVILSWWDNGYIIEDITGFATFTDGGYQRTNKTYLLSLGITSKSQTELYNVISLLNGNGSRVTPEAILSGQTSNTVMDNVKNDRLYLLYTRDLILKFSWIYSIRGVDPTRHSAKNELVLLQLQCNTFVNNVYGCIKYQVDMNRGLVNNTFPIKKAIYVRGGTVIKEVDYPNKSGLYLELFVRDMDVIALYLMNEEVYSSNFNQMYVLGNYDKNLYEETYNDFPAVRLFKVKGTI
ncbi:MAG: hypothetical protein HQL06_07175 [Nitrospirae bacterium]|nr:hypothetical protein [Nitrospirota bacterium]